MLRRTAFKIKPRKPLKRTILKARGTSDTSVLKERIQYLVREIVIKRDGGCVLRDSPGAGACGGYGSKSGKLILQGEHLVSRSHSASFADTNNIVCICYRHHFHFKKQHSKLYWDLIEGIIGPKRWEMVEYWEQEVSSHQTSKVDWKLAIIALEQELKQYK